jgi:hypothetical protein
LAITDSQITYFHAVVEKRLDGLPAVKELYERFRGTPLFDSYEILTPKVQVSGEVAVLTYLLAQHTGTVTTFWNATQVYQMRKEGWRVIHTHWSKGNGPRPYRRAFTFRPPASVPRHEYVQSRRLRPAPGP